MPRDRPCENKMTGELCKTEICTLIDEWIVGRNAERNRAIMKRRFVDGLTYEKLAEEFGLSVRQVKNIVYRSENKIIKHIQ